MGTWWTFEIQAHNSTVNLKKKNLNHEKLELGVDRENQFNSVTVKPKTEPVGFLVLWFLSFSRLHLKKCTNSYTWKLNLLNHPPSTLDHLIRLFMSCAYRILTLHWCSIVRKGPWRWRDPAVDYILHLQTKRVSNCCPCISCTDCHVSRCRKNVPTRVGKKGYPLYDTLICGPPLPLLYPPVKRPTAFTPLTYGVGISTQCS